MNIIFMVHYIYRIDILTGSLSGCYYIGAHNTRNINDGYRGSSKILKDWFNKKERIENKDYVFTILEFNDSKEENFKRERDYIGDLYQTDEKCLNIKSGGMHGPGNYKRLKFGKNTYTKMVNTRRANNSYASGGKKAAETRRKNGSNEIIGQKLKELYKQNPELCKTRGRKSGDTIIERGCERGDKHPLAREYIVTNIETKEVKIFRTSKPVCDYLNISASLLSMIIHGHRKQMDGFLIESRRIREVN